MEMQLAAHANRLRGSGIRPASFAFMTRLREEDGANPVVLSAVLEEPVRMEVNLLERAHSPGLHSEVSGAPSEYALDAVSESVFLMP